MADTPRVTVPVELVREKIAKLIDPEAFVPMEDVIGMRKAFVLADKIIANTGYDGINWKAEWEAVCSLRIAERDTLSAAPAPEGGAVSIWSDARNVFVRYAELFAMTERYEEASAIADKAAREIEALATREEAPAEAGGLSDAIAFLDAAAVMLGRGEMPAPGTPYAARWWQAHAVALSVLRAQTQAREDAQPVGLDVLEGWEDQKTPSVPGPVAWRCRNIGGVWSYGEAKQPNVAFCEPLYDHPAPDALRGAVEALKFYRDAWNSEPNGDPRIEGDANGSLTEPADALLDDKGARASVALAALQAEQKGGA